MYDRELSDAHFVAMKHRIRKHLNRWSMAVLIASMPTLVVANGWSPNTTIVTLYPISTGGVYVWFADHVNPDGCSQGTSWKYIEATHPNKDTIVSHMLTAITTGMTVKYFVSGCYAGTYPKILHFQLRTD